MRKFTVFMALIICGLMLHFTSTAQGSVDVTDSITNPSFELDGNTNTNITGWSNPNSFQTQNNTAFGYKGGTYYCEKWQSSSVGGWTDIGVSQTLNVMPNGLYRLTAAAMSIGGGAYIYANEDSTEVDAAGNYEVYFEVDADTIQLGFYVVDGSNYVTCDNFNLIFYGDSYASGLQALADSANAIVTAAADLGEFTTQTYADLQAAADSAQKIIEDVSATPEDYFNGEAYMEAAIAVYYKVVDLIEYEATWLTTLPYDATSVITNPSFETNSIEGWTNPNAFGIQSSAQSFKNGTYFCEIWQTSANGGWTDIGISQTIDYIPNGTYLLTASGQAVDQSDGSYPGNAYFFANDDSVEVFEANTYSVLTEVTDNTLNIGYALDGTSGNWLAFDNFVLKYLGDGAPVIVTSETEITLDEVNPSASFTVSGFNLTDSIITITAPSGFDFDIDTITVDTISSIAEETTITVNMTDTAMFTGNIDITCGETVQTITIVEGTKKFFTPDGTTQYYLKLEGFDKIMGSETTTPAIYDFEASSAQLFTIIESDSTAGEYFIKSSNNGYLHKVASSGWNMLFDEVNDSTLEANDDYHFTFTPLDNGCQLIHCVNAVGTDRYVGPNAGATTSGTTIYSDKRTSNGEVKWRFVDSENIDFDVSESYLTFDDYVAMGTFTITGNSNLLANFAIDSTSEFSVSDTLASWDGATTITVTFDASAEVKDYITISSSGVTKKVRVLGYLNATTYSPLYTNTTNMISDPYCTDISVYDAWGDEQLITDTLIIYGGRSCIGLPAGTNNSGSLNHTFDDEIDSDTYYRTSFAYRTIGGTMHLTYDDFYVDDQDGEVNFFLPNTDGDWVVFDTIVSSGSLDDATQSIYLNTYQATATELYIDNYQLNVVPLHVVEDSVADEFSVAVQSVVGTVSITAPTGITVNPTTLATDAGTATVTVSYDNSEVVGGYIVLTDGVESDSIYVSNDISNGISIPTNESSTNVYTTTGTINVKVSDQTNVVVYSIDGAIIANKAVESTTTISVKAGIYIVVVNDETIKVTVTE